MSAKWSASMDTHMTCSCCCREQVCLKSTQRYSKLWWPEITDRIFSHSLIAHVTCSFLWLWVWVLSVSSCGREERCWCQIRGFNDIFLPSGAQRSVSHLQICKFVTKRFQDLTKGQIQNFKIAMSFIHEFTWVRSTFTHKDDSLWVFLSWKYQRLAFTMFQGERSWYTASIANNDCWQKTTAKPGSPEQNMCVRWAALCQSKFPWMAQAQTASVRADFAVHDSTARAQRIVARFRGGVSRA